MPTWDDEVLGMGVGQLANAATSANSLDFQRVSLEEMNQTQPNGDVVRIPIRQRFIPTATEINRFEQEQRLAYERGVARLQQQSDLVQQYRQLTQQMIQNGDVEGMTRMRLGAERMRQEAEQFRRNIQARPSQFYPLPDSADTWSRLAQRTELTEEMFNAVINQLTGRGQRTPKNQPVLKDKTLLEAEDRIIQKTLIEEFIEELGKSMLENLDARIVGKFIERHACRKCTRGWIAIDKSKGEYELCECAEPEAVEA